MTSDAASAPDFLERELDRRARLNPRYSLRAFARTLGMSSGALSEILRGHRPLSLKAAAKIARALGLNAAEAERFYGLVDADRRNAIAPLAPPDPISLRQLDEDAFRLIAEWHHFAILNLMDCEGFRWNATWIARRLGLELSQARMAMALLLRTGLVRREGGGFVCAEDCVLAPAGPPSVAIREYHRRILEKAIDALELQSVDEREMTGVGFAVDRKRLPQIKREIAEFQDQLIARHSKGRKQDVYFLEMSLFRLTQGGAS